jgi:hypothetical protein
MHYHAELPPMVTLAQMAQNRHLFGFRGHFIRRMTPGFSRTPVKIPAEAGTPTSLSTSFPHIGGRLRQRGENNFQHFPMVYQWVGCSNPPWSNAAFSRPGAIYTRKSRQYYPCNSQRTVNIVPEKVL